MLVTNSTGDHFLIYLGSQNLLQIPAYGTLDVNVDLYVGNLDFQKQVDTLYEQGKVTVLDAPDGFPLSVVEESGEQGLPETFEVEDQNLILTKEQGVAGFSVETDPEDGHNYGVIKLFCDDGSVTEVSSYDKPFRVLIEGEALELDPSTATAEDVANALISLGLVAEA